MSQDTGTNVHDRMGHKTKTKGPSVLVMVSTDEMKHHDQKASWRERGLFDECPYHCSSLKEVRTGTQLGTWRQELM